MMVAILLVFIHQAMHGICVGGSTTKPEEEA